MSDIPPIVLEKVSHDFGRGELRKRILFDVSAEVQAGEILILTGPSGSGKTTLLTLSGALRSAQEGSLRVLDVELRGARESTLARVRRGIGYIFQSHNLLPALTVEQNVRMSAQLRRRESRNEMMGRIGEVLERVGISAHANKRIHQLSGGQRQRVAIARALVNRPKIVLADEPTASLDRESGRDVAELVQELAREEGASVVFVTHDSRILDVADRILHLEDGRLKPLREAVAHETTRMLHVLADHEPGSHRTLIGFAIALARVAHADRHLAQEEVEVIRRVLADVAELEPGEIEFVVSIAIESVRDSDTEVMTTFKRMAPTEKQRLVRALHAVAEADGEFTESERVEIERIVAELGP